MAKKKKSIKKQVLLFKTKKELPLKIENIRQVAKKLLIIFTKHIGENNRLSRMDLFYKVYSVSMYDVGELKAWFMWDIIRKACHFCRKYTRCAIISNSYKKVNNEISMRYYFVASSMAEAQIYTDILKKCQKAMDNAKKRIKRSVRNEHYKDTSKWVMP